jgi:hypothetical protein
VLVDGDKNRYEITTSSGMPIRLHELQSVLQTISDKYEGDNDNKTSGLMIPMQGHTVNVMLKDKGALPEGVKETCLTCAFYTRDFGGDGARYIAEDEPICGNMGAYFEPSATEKCKDYLLTGTEPNANSH